MLARSAVGLVFFSSASILASALATACGDDAPAAGPGGSPPAATTSPTPSGGNGAPGTTDAGAGSDSDSGADAATPRPTLAVDRTNPKRHDFAFTAKQADAAAAQSLGTQGAHLDTRVASLGKLVVFLHGAAASAPASCQNGEVANVLTAKGFHVLLPCYNSYYGVAACGTDIGGCRREAFEGVDHSTVVTIAPADAIEPRIVAGLRYLATQHPGGDWDYFLQDGKPYWPDIVIAGISHGASSAGLIAKIRPVDRAVMLSGPLDTGQAWLALPSITPPEKLWGFTHTADTQHAGHLAAFTTLGLPGAITTVDGAQPPYGGSHRFRTSAATADGHGSTAPGGASPKASGNYVFAPVWTTMFGH